MAERVMFIQLKTGYDIDQGPTWISSVRFKRRGTPPIGTDEGFIGARHV